jgi:hypothetical protein
MMADIAAAISTFSGFDEAASSNFCHSDTFFPLGDSFRKDPTQEHDEYSSKNLGSGSLTLSFAFGWA